VTDLENRRPIKARDTGWAKNFAATLANAHVQPNLISATSVAFAVLGGALLAVSGVMPDWVRPVAMIVAAACIQGRLLCNLLDGMVAVEHGEGSKTGPIWNELPDRIADLLFLVGAGYSAYGLGHNLGPNLGWLAGALAILTAYVRELGRGLGFPADFSGPMAKQQRMAALTILCFIAAVEPFWGGHGLVMVAGLIVIVGGTGWTVIRRVSRLARALAARP
jgi:phosphatidylglycerophosphate synthase